MASSISFGLFVVLILTVHPASLPLLFYLLPFLLLFLCFYYLFHAGLSKITRLKAVTVVVASFYFALFPTTVLIVRSINQLSVSDVVIVALLMLGSFLYLRYADFV